MIYKLTRIVNKEIKLYETNAINNACYFLNICKMDDFLLISSLLEKRLLCLALTSTILPPLFHKYL